MNIGTDFTTSHSRKDTSYKDNSLFGLGSGHGVSKHMVVGHLATTISFFFFFFLRGRFDKNPVLGRPGDVISDMRQ